MFVSICPHCAGLVDTTVRAADGVETIRYHCPHCNRWLTGFLLGYTDNTDEAAAPAPQPAAAQNTLPNYAEFIARRRLKAPDEASEDRQRVAAAA